MLRQDVIENILAEKNLEILVDEKLDMNQQCALTIQKANLNLGCTKSSGSRPGELILYLCSCETSPAMLHPDLESSAQE